MPRSELTSCGSEKRHPLIVFIQDHVVIGADELVPGRIQRHDLDLRIICLQPSDHIFSCLFGRGMANNKYVYITIRPESDFSGFIVSHRDYFVAETPQQFRPRIQSFFVIADLEHDPLGWRLNGNLLACVVVEDDELAGRRCPEHFHTRLGTFQVYRHFHPAKAAAFHLENIERRQHSYLLVTVQLSEGRLNHKAEFLSIQSSANSSALKRPSRIFEYVPVRFEQRCQSITIPCVQTLLTCPATSRAGIWSKLAVWFKNIKTFRIPIDVNNPAG